MLAAADGAPWPVSPDLPGVAGVVLYHAGRLLQVTGAKLLLIGFPVQCESDGLFRFLRGWAHVTDQGHYLHFFSSSLLMTTIQAGLLAVTIRLPVAR
jgi:hypothetical protein